MKLHKSSQTCISEFVANELLQKHLNIDGGRGYVTRDFMIRNLTEFIRVYGTVPKEIHDLIASPPL